MPVPTSNEPANTVDISVNVGDADGGTRRHAETTDVEKNAQSGNEKLKLDGEIPEIQIMERENRDTEVVGADSDSSASNDVQKARNTLLTKHLAGFWFTFGCIGGGGSSDLTCVISTMLSCLQPRGYDELLESSLLLGILIVCDDGCCMICPIIDVITQNHVEIQGLGAGCASASPTSTAEKWSLCQPRVCRQCKDDPTKIKGLPIPKAPLGSCKCPLISLNLIPTCCFYKNPANIP